MIITGVRAVGKDLMEIRLKIDAFSALIIVKNVVDLGNVIDVK